MRANPHLPLALIALTLLSATGEISNLNGNQVSQNLLIGLADPKNASIFESKGARVRETFHLISASVITLENNALGTEQSHFVRFVETDFPARALGDTIGWGQNMIGATSAWILTRGRGVKIAVLDSGIDFSHPDLKDRVKGGVSLLSPSSPSTNPEEWADRYGHGTAVAGIVAAAMNNIGVVGVSFEADLYAVKVLDDVGQGTYSSIIRGIQWAVDNGMQIVAMSLGGSSYSQALQEAVDAAHARGILLVAAAGNAGYTSGEVQYPAAFDSVLAVTAITDSGSFYELSSRGTEVDLAAPGYLVNTTLPGNRYGAVSGTSFAAPFITSAAAMIISANPQLTNVEVASILEATATDYGPSGTDPYFGHGVVNVLRALAYSRL